MVDSFLKYLQFEKRVSQHTVLAYQNDLHQFSTFLAETFHEQSPEKADHGMVRSWIVQLSDTNIDPRSINRKIATLRSYYKHLLRQEVITVTPMMKIKVLKTQKKLPSFVKEGDMINMLDNVTFDNTHAGWRERLILELFYGTGIRLSELINLKESNVDLFNRTIKVLGKRNKERVIPFSSSLVSILEGYRNARNKEASVKDHGLFFVTDKGDPCYAGMIYTIVKRNLDEHTTTEKRSPHVLRHTYATHLLNKGAEINAVKDLLGHTSLAATQVYTHNSLDKLKKVFQQAHPKA